MALDAGLGRVQWAIRSLGFLLSLAVTEVDDEGTER